MSKNRVFKGRIYLPWGAFFLFAFVGLVGCEEKVVSGENIQITVTADNSSPDHYEFQTSEAGYSTLHGMLVVLDPLSIIPAPDDAIFLVELDPNVPVSTIPTFDEDDDLPRADVDERTGEFVFTNVKPGRYAVVVVTRGGTQIPSRKMEDGSYGIFDVTEENQDQVIELGTLTLP